MDNRNSTLKTISVLIADDHAIVREGLRKLLNTQEDIDIVGEAFDGIDALEKVKRLNPDVVVLDISMPRMSGMEAVRLIREEAPQTQVVMLSMFDKQSYAKQMLDAGARAYVLKGAPCSELTAAIRAAHAGRYYLSHEMQCDMIDSFLEKPKKSANVEEAYRTLSRREQQVFQLIVEGHTTAKIADILCVSSKTVEKHRGNVVRKLGTNNLVDLVKYAVKIGVVDPELWKS